MLFALATIVVPCNLNFLFILLSPGLAEAGTKDTSRSLATVLSYLFTLLMMVAPEVIGDEDALGCP